MHFFFVPARVHTQTLNQVCLTNSLVLVGCLINFSAFRKASRKGFSGLGRRKPSVHLGMRPPVRVELITLTGACKPLQGHTLFCSQSARCPGDSGKNHCCLGLGGRRRAASRVGVAETPRSVSLSGSSLLPSLEKGCSNLGSCRSSLCH